MALSSVKTPTLLISKEKCIINIRAMIEKADKNNLILRPHFKTHQSATTGQWFKESGINKITVSSVQMAEYFTDHGWRDITIAFPVNIRQTDEINRLSSEIKLNILISSLETAKHVSKHIKFNTGVFIEIDTGYNRSGISPDETTVIENLINTINNSSRLIFKGFLTHNGQTYNSRSKSEIIELHKMSIAKLEKLKYSFAKYADDILISIGDTPSCSICDNFSGTDEIRPGNFIFYDLQQYYLGSCTQEEISVCMLCPVIEKNSSRKEIVVHGGAVHFSKESVVDENNNRCYGKIVQTGENSWGKIIKNTYLSQISQEHGIIKCSDEYYDSVIIGDLAGILPVHSCLTRNLMLRKYLII